MRDLVGKTMMGGKETSCKNGHGVTEKCIAEATRELQNYHTINGVNTELFTTCDCGPDVILNLIASKLL
jgi:hypothetical protein